MNPTNSEVAADAPMLRALPGVSALLSMTTNRDRVNGAAFTQRRMTSTDSSVDEESTRRISSGWKV